MTDILIQEQNSGGDFIYLNNDLAAASLYENMPYLAMLGGDDWFMNDLIEGDDSTKFLCRTERLCKETTLNSEGRLIIENGVIADLQFLTENIPGSTLTVNVLIVGNDRVQINVVFNGRLFTFLINKNDAPDHVCGIATGLATGTIITDSIAFSWNPTAAAGYEWFITTVNVEPAGTGTFVSTSTINVTGLLPDTTYYFWVRCICSGSVSSLISITAATAAIPALPITTGLKGFYVASYGVTLNGSNKVIQWDDLSGQNNHLLPVSTPTLTISANEFGTEVAANFAAGTDILRTASDFVGLTGSDKLTIFVVKKYSVVPNGQCVMMYALTDNTIIPDGFAMYQSAASGTPYDRFEAKGNVGMNEGAVNASTGAHIYSIVANKSNPAATEVVIKLDKTTTGTGSGSNNAATNYGSYKLTVGVSSGLSLAHFIGKIGCIAIYTGALSGADVDSITDYLMAKYSI